MAMLQPEGCVGLHLPTGTRVTIVTMNSRAAVMIAVATVTLTEEMSKDMRCEGWISYAGLAL